MESFISNRGTYQNSKVIFKGYLEPFILEQFWAFSEVLFWIQFQAILELFWIQFQTHPPISEQKFWCLSYKPIFEWSLHIKNVYFVYSFVFLNKDFHCAWAKMTTFCQAIIIIEINGVLGVEWHTRVCLYYDGKWDLGMNREHCDFLLQTTKMSLVNMQIAFFIVLHRNFTSNFSPKNPLKVSQPEED